MILPAKLSSVMPNASMICRTWVFMDCASSVTPTDSEISRLWSIARTMMSVMSTCCGMLIPYEEMYRACPTTRTTESVIPSTFAGLRSKAVPETYIRKEIVFARHASDEDIVYALGSSVPGEATILEQSATVDPTDVSDCPVLPDCPLEYPVG